jgi:hypothetical protein
VNTDVSSTAPGRMNPRVEPRSNRECPVPAGDDSTAPCRRQHRGADFEIDGLLGRDRIRGSDLIEG